MKKIIYQILAVFLAASQAFAVTYDTTTSNQKSGSGTTLTKAHTMSAGANGAIFVLCGLDDAVITLTATYAGAAMTEVRRDQHGSGGTSTWIFKKLAPATGANNWVVTQSSADNMICYAVSATDVDQVTGTTEDTGSCPAAGTSISNAVTSAGNDDLVVDIVGLGTTGHTLVTGADQTQRMNLTQGTAYESAGATQLGSISGDAMSWTWTTNEVACQSVVAIKDFVPATRPIAPIIIQ